MDIFSIPKWIYIRITTFFKQEFLRWLQAIKNPLAVLPAPSADTSTALLESMRFALFVNFLVLFAVYPPYSLYFHLDMLRPLIMLLIMGMNAFGFLLIGVVFHYSAKAFGGKAPLHRTIVASLYLMAYWPLLELTDYFVLPSKWLTSFIKDEPHTLWPPSDEYVFVALFFIIFFLMAFFLTKKTIPVLKHVHGFGIIRATLATLIGLLVILGLFNVSYYPLLKHLIKGGI